MRELLMDRGDDVEMRYFVKWARQISNAMNYLHTRSNPVIHLDMKCGNVLLNRLDYRRASVKIIDFGRSQSLEAWNSHLKHVDITTPAYAAPELLTNVGIGLLAKPLDVYSTGVMFGYMFSGIAPWENERSIWSIYDKVRQGHRPKIVGGARKVPKWLRLFVLKPMLLRSAEMRPSFNEIANRIKVFEEKCYGRRKSMLYSKATAESVTTTTTTTTTVVDDSFEENERSTKNEEKSDSETADDETATGRRSILSESDDDYACVVVVDNDLK